VGPGIGSASRPTKSSKKGWPDQVAGPLTKPGGSFKIDHPLDAEHKYLSHSFVESPEMMNIYRGTVTTDEHGQATVELPDSFTALNMDFGYQITPIGVLTEVAVISGVEDNQFVIRSGKPTPRCAGRSPACVTTRGPRRTASGWRSPRPPRTWAASCTRTSTTPRYRLMTPDPANGTGMREDDVESRLSRQRANYDVGQVAVPIDQITRITARRAVPRRHWTAPLIRGGHRSGPVRVRPIRLGD